MLHVLHLRSTRTVKLSVRDSFFVCHQSLTSQYYRVNDIFSFYCRGEGNTLKTCQLLNTNTLANAVPCVRGGRGGGVGVEGWGRGELREGVGVVGRR